MVVKKSDMNSETFDTVVFGYSKISVAILSSNIKHIAPYAFYYCYDLFMVTFGKNSELTTIGKNAFCETGLKSIILPKSVQKIGKKAFSHCSYLKKVTFEEGSELESFEKETFCQSGIETLSIPSKVKELKYCWCSYTKNLINVVLSPENPNFKYLDKECKIVVGKSDLTSEIFDTIVFACRDVVSVFVPSFIKFIKTFAFDNCKLLKSVVFEDNSELLSIERNAFSSSSIEEISIPKHVKKIQKRAFLECKYLKKILFDENSELVYVGNYAFNSCSIVEITIPRNVTKVGKLALSDCADLKSVTFLSDTFFIDEDFFSGCSKLSCVSIPNAKVVMKDKDPFEETSKNLSLKIGNGVTPI